MLRMQGRKEQFNGQPWHSNKRFLWKRSRMATIGSDKTWGYQQQPTNNHNRKFWQKQRQYTPREKLGGETQAKAHAFHNDRGKGTHENKIKHECTSETKQTYNCDTQGHTGKDMFHQSTVNFSCARFCWYCNVHHLGVLSVCCQAAADAAEGCFVFLWTVSHRHLLNLHFRHVSQCFLTCCCACVKNIPSSGPVFDGCSFNKKPVIFGVGEQK